MERLVERAEAFFFGRKCGTMKGRISREKEVPGPLELGEVKAAQFRQAVARLRGVKGKPAPEVEFFHHWPKHEHLSEEQLRWFLYWRSLWECGVVRKTSLSYMMIHVYELLSGEYIRQPELAVERLIRFYTEFRDVQPRLDATVVRWIADFYLKMGDLDNAVYWYTKGTFGDPFEKLSWYRFARMEIPLALLWKIAQGSKSQFYRKRAEWIEPKLEEMMASVFRVYEEIEGVHPLDKLARYADDPTIYLFSSTPIHEKAYLDGFRRYESSGAFVHFVRACLRYGENLFRRVEGKGRLKCDEEVRVYFREWEALFPEPVKPVAAKRETAFEQEGPVLVRTLPEEPVEIDLARVRRLAQETEWLVEMMHEENPQEELLWGSKQVGQAEKEGELPCEPLIGGMLGFGADEGDLSEWLKTLLPNERAFLQRVVSGETERRGLSEWLKGKRMFLDALVLQVNEKAMEAGLEPVLEEDGEEIRVSLEYAAVLKEALAE
jgi:hypothetical protein